MSRSFAFGRTNWSPEMIRALLDFVDQNKGEDGLFVRDTDQAGNEAAKYIERVVPSNRYAAQDKNQVLKKIYHLWGKCHHVRRPIRELYMGGAMVIPIAKLPPGVYSEEEIQNRSRIGTNSDSSPDIVGNYDSSTPREHDTAFQLEMSQQLAKLSNYADKNILISSQALKSDIEKEMVNLHTLIASASTERIRQGNIDGRSILMIDVNLYDKALVSLLEIVVGPNRLGILDCKDPEARLRMTHFQTSLRLELRYGARALIAAAVTKWVLEPLPQGGHELFGVLEQEFSLIAPIPYEVMYEGALRKYIEQNVAPFAHKRARAFAIRLNELLSPIFARHSKLSFEPTVQSVADYIPISEVTSLPAWYSSWIDDLTQIFEDALRARAEWEIKGGRFLFHFPSVGDCFSRDVVEANSGPVLSNIQIGLLPRVFASYRSRRGEGYGDPVLVSKGKCTAMPV